MQISDLTTGIAFVIGLCLFPICLCIDNYLNERSEKKRRKQQMDKDYGRISFDELKQLKTELSSEILRQDLIEKVVNIPDNATNKDVMCTFFGQVTLDKVMCIDPEWFNSPYGTGRKGATDEGIN